MDNGILGPILKANPTPPAAELRLAQVGIPLKRDVIAVQRQSNHRK